jgi:lipopolysaccharide export system permease protein
VLKKLDILILRAFAGPFIATLLISEFVLVMQFMWLYIDDLVGKGLDVLTILKLVSFVAATAIQLALPLALLLSSIMTFGNLGERFELVAIKSAGIPLLRFMRPLFVVAVLLSGVAFLFANNIIPVAQLKLNALKYDIIVKKPAFDLKEGVFFDKLEGYVIKVGKKEKDDSTIRNVIIYEKTFGLQDHFLVADYGVMHVTKDNFLQFKLHNGWNYFEDGARYNQNTEFTRFGFKDYIKEFDLRSFNMTNTKDSLFYDPKMLTLPQLGKAIDSLNNGEKDFFVQTERNIYPYMHFLKYRQKQWDVDAMRRSGGGNNAYYNAVPDKFKKKVRDSLWLTPLPAILVKNAKSFDVFIPDDLNTQILDKCVSTLSIIKGNVDILGRDYQEKQKVIRSHRIEWHRKLTLSFACLVLFMIGAPLGSIIRKGGLGTPLVFAVIFFVVFHLLNTFGEKFAKEGITTELEGMWLSTAVLVPIGIFLTVKAMHDSELFNKEFYSRVFKQVKTLIEKLQAIYRKKVKKASAEA